MAVLEWSAVSVIALLWARRLASSHRTGGNAGARRVCRNPIQHPVLGPRCLFTVSQGWPRATGQKPPLGWAADSLDFPTAPVQEAATGCRMAAVGDRPVAAAAAPEDRAARAAGNPDQRPAARRCSGSACFSARAVIGGGEDAWLKSHGLLSLSAWMAWPLAFPDDERELPVHFGQYHRMGW